MEFQFINPQYNQPVFKCANCNKIASHKTECVSQNGDQYSTQRNGPVDNGTFDKHLHQIFLSHCNECASKSIWVRSKYGNEQRIFPQLNSNDFPEPHIDMPDDVKKTYNEAGDISRLSPRASAALSRLALEQLLSYLDYNDSTLYKKIESLISQGNTDSYLAQALEVVRNFGNSGAHAGEIQLEEDPSITIFLLKLLNIIVERLITLPQKTAELFNSIPESKRKNSPANKVTSQ